MPDRNFAIFKIHWNDIRKTTTREYMYTEFMSTGHTRDECVTMCSNDRSLCFVDTDSEMFTKMMEEQDG